MTNERALVDLFHDALDAEDVAGPFQRLQLELEKPTGAALLRRTRRTFMTRQRIALLAAALVIVVVAGVLVSTRISSNFGRNTTEPGSSPSPAHVIDQAAVNRLLAKPLHFQTLKPGDPCPDSTNLSNGDFGAGPAFGVANAVASTTAWGTYWSVSILTPLGTPGPVVVRPSDLTHATAVLDIGPYGAGPVYATDVYQGTTVKQFRAVAFDTDGVTKSSLTLSGIKYVEWDYLQGFKKGWGGGCVGAQIDSPSFSEIFYADVPNN